jgi:hypothetical protein
MSEQLLREYIAESLYESSFDEGFMGDMITKGEKARQSGKKAFAAIAGGEWWTGAKEMASGMIEKKVTKILYGKHSEEYRELQVKEWEAKIKSLREEIRSKTEEQVGLTAKVKEAKSDKEKDKFEQKADELAEEIEELIKAKERLETSVRHARYLRTDMLSTDKFIEKIRPEITIDKIGDEKSAIRKKSATIQIQGKRINDPDLLIDALTGDFTSPSIQEFYSKLSGIKMNEDAVKSTQIRLHDELKALK